MAAPCINDTCSISSLIDPVTRRLEINAVLNNSMGIECVDGQGISARLMPTLRAAGQDTCFQQMGFDASGQMFSIPHRARVFDFSGGPVNIPQGQPAGEGNASSEAITTGLQVTNPFSCSAMMLVIGRFEVGFTISYTDSAAGSHGNPTVDDGSGVMIPFNGEVRGVFRTDGFERAVSFMPFGGIVPLALNNSHRRVWEYFAFRQTIAGGATVDLSATANHIPDTSGGDGHGVNIITVNPATAPVFSDRGFACRGEVIIMPFNNQ